MKLAQTGRVFWQISPLLLFLLLPALAFGFWQALAATALALVVHESAHIGMGKLLGVNTVKVEIMPFGGVSQMESCSPIKMALIAMAGPLCNAAIVLCFLPIVKYNPYQWLCVFLQANLAIAIFNLLPAFPLDGGRILICMLTPIIGQTIALRICMLFGLVLGLFLAGAGVACLFYFGQVNLSLLIVGGFLCAGALRQGKPGPYTALIQENEKKKRLKKQSLKDQRLVMHKDVTVAQAAEKFHKGSYATVTVVGHDLQFLGSLGEKEILDAMVNSGPQTTLQQALDS